MTEAELWQKLKERAPRSVRIENTAGSGFPDVLVPAVDGWVPVELKKWLGNFVYFQKYQIAFYARCLKLPWSCQPRVLIYSPASRKFSVVNSRGVLECRRLPARDGKVAVDIPEPEDAGGLDDAVAKITYFLE